MSEEIKQLPEEKEVKCANKACRNKGRLCTSEICHKGFYNCNRRHLDIYHPFCNKCTCSVACCKNLHLANSKFCNYHRCKDCGAKTSWEQSSEVKDILANFLCTDIVSLIVDNTCSCRCKVFGCKKPNNGRIYCTDHRCLLCFRNILKAEGKRTCEYCSRYYNKGNTMCLMTCCDKEKGLGDYCYLHTCFVDGCRQHKAFYLRSPYNYRYCSQHYCRIAYCNNQRHSKSKRWCHGCHLKLTGEDLSA